MKGARSDKCATQWLTCLHWFACVCFWIRQVTFIASLDFYFCLFKKKYYALSNFDKKLHPLTLATSRFPEHTDWTKGVICYVARQVPAFNRANNGCISFVWRYFPSNNLLYYVKISFIWILLYNYIKASCTSEHIQIESEKYKITKIT